MNAVDMDPTHPAYAYVRDFQYRQPVSKSVQGWTWTKGGGLPAQRVPLRGPVSLFRLLAP